MKVVHLSTTDYGGAYKAAARISESMRQCGVDSELLIRTKTRPDTPGTEIFTNPVQKFVSKAKNLGNLLLSDGEVVSDYLGTDVSKHPLVKEADVVILHWVNAFISYKSVEQLLQAGKPIIWVMHDMWLFTGGCHCSNDCSGYQQGCTACPHIRRKAIAQKNFKKKKNMLSKNGLIIVGPSSWIVECAKGSAIAKGKAAYIVHNPIDTELYRPLSPSKETEEFKVKHKIPRGKKVLLLGAVNIGIGGLKGFDLLKDILDKLDPEHYVCMIFGNHQWLEKINTSVQIINLGFISSENELVQIYNTADVFISLSKQDNYPNVLLEAAACQIPIAAFNIGGISDIVKHKETGYLVTYGDLRGLIEGITYCVANKEVMGIKSRQNIEKNNRYEVIGTRYRELVQRCIEKNGEK